MASEVEYINYKDFVESLPARTAAKSSDKTVVSNSTDGPGSETNAAQAQKVLAGNVAAAFDPLKTSGAPYKIGELVSYNGETFAFIKPYYGDWDGSYVVKGPIDELLPLSQSKEFSVVGANSTVKYGYVFLQKGTSKISVKATPNPWPTDTIGGSNPNILIIYAVDDAGTETNLRQYGVSSTIPEEISIDVPRTAVMLKFFIRANYQSVVSFSVVNTTTQTAIQDEVNAREALNSFAQKIMESNAVAKVTMVGAGMGAVQNDFELSAFDSLEIVPSSTSWAVSSLTDNANKFWIRLYKRNGSYADTNVFSKNTTLPSKIVLSNLLIHCYGDIVSWSIFFRADVGASVDFNVKYLCSGGVFTPMRALFEMGNVSISTDSLVYSASSIRAVSKQGFIVDFKAGDVISLDDGYRMFLAVSATGAAPYTLIYWTKSYRFSSDLKLAAFLISKDPEGATTLDELLSAIHINSVNNKFNPSYSAFVKDALFGGVLLGGASNVLNGKGTTAVIQRYDCNGGTPIVVSLSSVSWAVSSLTDSMNKFVIRWVSNTGSTTNLVQVGKSGSVDSRYVVTLPEEAVAVEVFFRGDVGASVSYNIVNGWTQFNDRKCPGIDLVKSINHRGYNIQAPENTLPAFRLSAKKGFSIVETDVWACGDGTIVCIHDSTVDRTSDGTGSVTSMTLEQLKALDFGSWFNEKFAGTKIPTLTEFLATCRNLGLKTYIEIKGLTNSSVANLVKEVKSLGMGENVTYICFTYSYLQEVVLADKKARVGYLLNTISETDVQDAVALKTDENEIFINAAKSAVTSESIALAKSYGIPIEVWTATAADITDMDSYVSGFTSDYAIASDILYSKEV